MNTTSFSEPSYSPTKINSIIGSFTAQVFGWMTLGLLITTIVAAFINYIISNSYELAQSISAFLPFIFLIEIIIVIGLSALWQKINGLISLGMFILYAAFNGIFIGLIASIYTLDSIIFAFGLGVVVFLLLAIYGTFTKNDLTKIGNIALFGLVGLVFGTLLYVVISLFNPALSNGIYLIMMYIGIAVFCILIAYDAQKLRLLASEAEQNPDKMLRYTIRGALTFYLDFINLFIRILALTGRRRR